MIKSLLSIFFESGNLFRKGQILFLVGIFFLPSTLMIGAIFLIPQ